MPQTLQFIPLEKLKVPRPVERLAWFEQKATDKAVLDLGALDETALNKAETPFWLHGRLAKVARTVLGVDLSPTIPEEGLKTSENSKIISGNVYDTASLINANEIEVIVAGEIIEHLDNTNLFLKNIKKHSDLKGKKLLLSTPNTTSLHNCVLGVLSRESCHQDHLQVYSFKTLHRLCSNADFQDWQLTPYYSKFTEMIISQSGYKKRLLQLAEKMCNGIEFLFPMLSGGWIVEITI